MSERQHDVEPIKGRFDRVTIESQRGRLTTLGGNLPYSLSGFHWQFVTETPERVRRAVGDTAVGTIDGDVTARGVVNEVQYDARGLAEVFVSPPHGGQTKPTHWL